MSEPTGVLPGGTVPGPEVGAQPITVSDYAIFQAIIASLNASSRVMANQPSLTELVEGRWFIMQGPDDVPTTPMPFGVLNFVGDGLKGDESTGDATYTGMLEVMAYGRPKTDLTKMLNVQSALREWGRGLTLNDRKGLIWSSGGAVQLFNQVPDSPAMRQLTVVRGIFPSRVWPEWVREIDNPMEE